MTTRELIVGTLKVLREIGDAYYSEYDEYIDVTLLDFGGFDEHWGETSREYNSPGKVRAFIRMLETKCTLKKGDFYIKYYFGEEFYVKLGWESYCL